MEIDDFKGTTVTVMGLGRYLQGSGLGTIKWLLRHEAKVIVTDLKTEDDLKSSVDEVWRWFEIYRTTWPEKQIQQPIFILGQHRREDFIGVQAVFRNPDVPNQSEFLAAAREHHLPIFSDVSFFLKFCPFSVMAVTGTRGKTTTTTLLGEMVKRIDARTVVAGNLKVSPLEFLDEILTDRTPRFIILELSSTMLETLEESEGWPEIGLMTNFYPDHLNRYASLAAYKQAKEGIFRHQNPEQKMILNADDEEVREMANRVKGRLFWFSGRPRLHGEKGVYVQDDNLMIDLEGLDRPRTILPIQEIALAGQHNLMNAAAAAAAAALAGVPFEEIASVLRTFTGVEFRQQLERELNGVKYINDTTATSPEGTIAALQRFGVDGRIVLIAGGASKNLSFDKMAKEIIRVCSRLILLEGTATNDLERAVAGAVPTVKVSSMSEAVRLAASLTQPGENVLLSPGCASFGLFQNEFDRGEQFRRAVHQLT